MKKLILLLTAFAIVSCAPEKNTKPAPTEEKKVEKVAKKTEENPVFSAPAAIQKASMKVYIFDFEIDKAKIPASEMVKIKDLAAKLDALSAVLKTNQFKEKVTVTIQGYADARGPRKYNIKLSEERAANVEKALKAELKSTEFIQFKTEGLGMSDPYDSKKPLSGKNRRVYIFFP